MIGIFYGSSTGNTESLAKEIASKLSVGAGDVHDVANASVSDAAKYDLLILGSSTWGLGDLQDDWEGFLSKLKAESLAGKKVALFGCGDSGLYPDTFCDAVGIIREELSASGCTFVGELNSDYSSIDSKAFDGGKAIGLLVDDDQAAKTPARLDAWVAAIKNA